jgi:hypothetical protein
MDSKAVSEVHKKVEGCGEELKSGRSSKWREGIHQIMLPRCPCSVSGTIKLQVRRYISSPSHSDHSHAYTYSSLIHVKSWSGDQVGKQASVGLLCGRSPRLVA